MDKNGGKDILHEHRTNRTLNEKMRKKLVSIVVDLIIHHFGYYPSASEKTMVAKATANLFPCFKTCQSEDGIVSSIDYFHVHFKSLYIFFVNKNFAKFQELFYNVKSKSGWILSNLKNRRVADNQNKNSNDTEKEDENTHDDQMEENTEEYTEENAKDDCIFLRSVVVNSSNRAIIEKKLIATVEYRKKICMDPDNNLLKQFPCLFTHSYLVSCNFMWI